MRALPATFGPERRRSTPSPTEGPYRAPSRAATARPTSRPTAPESGKRLAARRDRKPRFALVQSRYDRPMWSLFYRVIRILVRLIVIGDLRQRDE
jgi:hypothetical protein